MTHRKQLRELVVQSLEHEQAGALVYEMALQCALNDELRREWERYLEQTRNHERVLLRVCEEIGVDPERSTPGREIVRHVGGALLEAMRRALAAGDAAAAQLVACECVVLAETKDHLDWELLGQVAQKSDGEDARALGSACEEIEEQEDEHLYHSKGWCRELWIDALGLRAVLPPPEEQRHVKTAIGAARAQRAADAAR